MIKWSLSLLLLALLIQFPESAQAKNTHYTEGRLLFEKEFNPENYFGFDYQGVRPDGSVGLEELILTAKVSARDGYLPEYALAVAYVCEADPENEDRLLCGFAAKMLRVKTDKDGSAFHNAKRLVSRLRKARGKRERRKAFTKSDLEWLEVDLASDCPAAVEDMDKLATKADWKPSLHYSRIKMDDRELILHPAQMWITMNGNEQISSWQGWRNADGAAFGVRNLMETLDTCWKPGTSPAPWKHK